MRTILPILWYVLGGIGLLLVLIPVSGSQLADNHMMTMTVFLPRAVTGLVASIAIGLAYALLLRTRPSTPAVAFGILHFIAATLSRFAMHAGDTYQRAMMSGEVSASDIAARLGMAYGAASLLGVLGWLFFIVALIVALNTSPPAEDAF